MVQGTNEKLLPDQNQFGKNNFGQNQNVKGEVCQFNSEIKQ